MNIKTFEEIKNELSQHGVKLVAVSKTQSAEKIEALYRAGQRIFGENKVQELCDKKPLLPHDIEWHFIGHLQSNKVKFIAPFVNMIHSVDSLKLLIEINKQALKNQRTINCLLQFRIAKEETKFGLSEAEAKEILESASFASLHHVRMCGVMGMATYTNDEKLIEEEFKLLKNIFTKLKSSYFQQSEYFKEISMGMSNDYKIGIQCGSTLVRIGSKLFGERNY